MQACDTPPPSGSAIWALLTALPLAISAQPSTPLAENDPVVIEHLVRLHDALTSSIAKRNIDDPQRASARANGLRGIFSLSEAGYAKTNAALSAAKAQLDQIESEHQQYISSLIQTRSEASDAELNAFSTRKNAVLKAAIVNLRSQLGDGDWQALRRFIATDIIGKLKAGRLVNAAPK